MLHRRVWAEIDLDAVRSNLRYVRFVVGPGKAIMAIVKANVNVDSARISGILLGDLTAKAKLELASDGRMVGNILAPKLVVNDGATFRGKVDMPNLELSREEAPAEKPPAEVTMEAIPPADPAVVADAELAAKAASIEVSATKIASAEQTTGPETPETMDAEPAQDVAAKREASPVPPDAIAASPATPKDRPRPKKRKKGRIF